MNPESAVIFASSRFSSSRSTASNLSGPNDNSFELFKVFKAGTPGLMARNERFQSQETSRAL